MPLPRPTGLWRTPTRHPLLWRAWDGQAVVYHDGSGDTHLLNATAFAGLQALHEAPADVAELARRVAAALNVPLDETLENNMAALVTDLHRLRLVEPLADSPPAGAGGRSTDPTPDT